MELIIDLTSVNNDKDLHQLLKDKLEFPDFYGMNWDAFWDSITGLVEMPHKLIFIGFVDMQKRIPESADMLKEILQQMNDEYPSIKCEVIYK